MTAPISKNKEVLILSRPRITEKASVLAGDNVYVFNVPRGATKPQIKRAVSERYKVTPVKIRTINMAARNVFVRGKKGTQSGGRKAYVYLKKGDKIEIA